MKNLSNHSKNLSSVCPFASTESKSATVDDSIPTKDAASSLTERNPSITSCPYAHALHNNDSNDDSSSSSSTLGSSSPPLLPISTRLKACPVFANHSCPFKEAKSPEEVQQIFSKLLPPSHIDASPTQAVLFETIANFHRDEDMEKFSLAAIMSRLVQERHHQQQGIDEDGDQDSDEFLLPLKVEEKETGASLPSASSNDSDDEQQQSSSRQQSRRLSEALKLGTEDAHKEAESVHFVKNFIRGKIDRSLYALFIEQLFHVYKHLERALDEHATKHFSECHFPKELNRLSALQDDIDFWGDGETLPPISSATRDYIDRIEVIAKERPILLLAHAYTRYLGDLSGGKILARVAKRALMLDSGPDGLTEGLAFYDFPLLKGSIIAFKDKYRQALNDLQFDDNTVEEIVQEANVAFLMNMRLFEELDVIGSVPQAKVRPLEEVYRYASSTKLTPISSSSTTNEEEEGKEKSPAPCPFLTSRSSSINTTTTATQQHQDISGKICPWPFILLHDPNAGIRKWQTWLFVGLLLTFIYQQYLISL
jgi:heme oxygenase